MRHRPHQILTKVLNLQLQFQCYRLPRHCRCLYYPPCHWLPRTLCQLGNENCKRLKMLAKILFQDFWSSRPVYAAGLASLKAEKAKLQLRLNFCLLENQGQIRQSLYYPF